MMFHSFHQGAGQRVDWFKETTQVKYENHVVSRYRVF